MKKLVFVFLLFLGLSASSQNVLTQPYRSTTVRLYPDLLDTAAKQYRGFYKITFLTRNDSTLVFIKQNEFVAGINLSSEIYAKGLPRGTNYSTGEKVLTFNAVDLRGNTPAILGLAFNKDGNLAEVGVSDLKSLIVFIIDQHYTTSLKSRL